MKKLTTIFALLFFSGVLFAQEAVVTWDGLKKQKEKSDADITNAKKNSKPKTWVKRAKTYYDIHTFVLQGLYKGMPKKNAQLIIGKPEKMLKKGNEEIWEYKRKKVYFIGGVADHWEQTDFIDKDALAKSADALLKAVELDDKGKGKLKSKTTTKNLNQSIKNTIIDVAIGFYQDKKYDKAYEYMAKGGNLCKLPKIEADTFYQADKVEYFLGIIAFNGKKYDNSEKHFLECVKSGYEPGISYHYLAETYKEQGSDQKFLSTIKKGFEKNPNEEQLLIDLINYYLKKGEEKNAVEYIDIAIRNNPKNPSYYSAKATIYDNKTDTLTSMYNKHMEEAYEFKKEAYRNRTKANLKAASEKKRDDALAEATKYFEEIKTNIAKADKLYNKSLEIKSDFFNAAYNIGRLDLKLNDLYAKHADWWLKVFINKDFQKSGEFETKAKGYLKSATDKFESALKIQPNDRDLLNILKRIYYKLRDKANLERIEKQIEALGAEEKTIE